jgi:hypothetical protein
MKIKIFTGDIWCQDNIDVIEGEINEFISKHEVIKADTMVNSDANNETVLTVVVWYNDATGNVK